MQIANTFESSQYNNASGPTEPYVKSGVFSHWFYILVNGETGINGVGSAYSASGIGLDNAEELIVEAVFNNFLDNTTTYPAIRTAILSAAEALYGECSPEYISTANAWNAIGVGNAASGPISSKYTYGGSPTYVASGNYGIGVSSSSQTIYIQLGNYGASSVYDWSITSQNGGYASISFNGREVTMSLGPGAYRLITCEVTTETCGVASVSISGYNFGGSFMVTAYPNPVDEILTISVTPQLDTPLSFAEYFENGRVELLSEAGKLVAIGTLSSKTCTLNVSTIPPGRYFLNIGTPKEKITEQILIRH